MTALRGYQIRAIEAAREHVRKGKRAVIIVLPMGGGKTKTAAEIIRSHVALGGVALFMAHRTELVTQAARALEEAGLRVGVIAASSDRPLDLEAPVQVASTQTLIARNVALAPTLIVLDECHHYPSEDWSQLVARYPTALRIGLSATPARQNGAGLSPMFDALVVGATIRQLTAKGYLAPLDMIAPSRVLETGKLAQSPLAAYAKHAHGRRCVVFAPHLKAATTYRDEFEAAGIRANVVSGELATSTRAERLEAYESGRVPVLVNCGVLTEGWDSPATGMAILARRCGSVVLYLQIAGRILRPHESKDRALFVDLTGAVHIHGRPDADRVFALEGRAIRHGEDAPAGSFCAVCGALMVATVCDDCGAERRALDVPTVINAPIKLLAKDFCAGDSPEKRLARLTKWTIEGKAKGHKPTAVLYRFKSVYGRPPTREEIHAARVFERDPGQVSFAEEGETS